MSVALSYPDICVRVLLTALVGAALGFDRSVAGHAAGVKTTTLVALAACLAMVQANWLMDSVGKAPDSFVVLDLMRLPLGILTGVGFIGGGAILKRGDDVFGLTTAALLWFVTVIGLAFGGGQLALGLGGAAVGFAVLRGLAAVERRLPQRRIAELCVKWRSESFDAAAALATMAAAGLATSRLTLGGAPAQGVQELRCAVRLYQAPNRHGPPAAVAALARQPGVLAWRWSE